MKMKNLLTAFVFVLAVGSSLASALLLPQNAYSKKADVPGQVENCVFRGQCDGSTVACQISFDHDNNSLTAPITRNMYSTNTGTCGVQLMQN
jgi:hypothetical protein